MTPGVLMMRLYQRTLSLPTVLATPDNADSTAKGTNILPSYFEGAASLFVFGTMAYCHMPLRLFQRSLTICGLGYSGNTFSGDTLSDHCVVIFPFTIFQSPWAEAEKEATSKKA